MRKFYKNTMLLLMVITLAACDNDNNGLGVEEPTSGWVDFPSAGTSLSSVATEVDVPVDINVPIYENGMTISYELEAVQGDFNDIVTSPSSGSIFVSPDDYSRVGTINIQFSSLVGLPELITFDVVLTSVTANGDVSVGFGEESITRYRVSSPCPFIADDWSGTYSVDEVFTSGTNEGLTLAGAFGESYQVEIMPAPNDPSGEKLMVNNSAGFNQYFPNGTIMTFITCTGEVTFVDDTVNLALFADHALDSVTFDEDNFVITGSGSLGNFGPYQWVLTKQ